jgi:hypothetical protein
MARFLLSGVVMHKTRTPRQRKLLLHRETLRRLDTLSEAELRQAIGGQRMSGTIPAPSIMPTGDGEGC